jgi:hypothetical protein
MEYENDVVFVMLLKVKGRRYNKNIVTLRVFLICAYCLHIVRCVENVQIKDFFVKLKCEVSCLNWILVKIQTLPCNGKRIALKEETAISDPRV